MRKDALDVWMVRELVFTIFHLLFVIAFIVAAGAGGEFLLLAVVVIIIIIQCLA